jgi:hypothetical protein
MYPDTNRKIVEVYRTVYEPAYSEDGTLEDHSELDCTPDEDDIEDGRKTPVDMAVYYLRDELYISGQDTASGYVPNPNYAAGSGLPRCLWPGPGTWFADEPYHHPYFDQREETTAHLSGGWTDEEKRTIWARVTDNTTPMDMSWVTDELFDEKLREIIDRGPASSLLSVPGIYELLSEHHNNQVLEELDSDRDA